MDRKTTIIKKIKTMKTSNVCIKMLQRQAITGERQKASTAHSSMD
jgi:hypothetical protein